MCTQAADRYPHAHPGGAIGRGKVDEVGKQGRSEGRTER